MSTIKWGQRCIARRFETVTGVISWGLEEEKVVGKECIVTRLQDNGTVLIDFEGDGHGRCFMWLPSALEPIPETPNVWWPVKDDKVMYNGEVNTVVYVAPKTHLLYGNVSAYISELSPVPTTEITPEEAVALLEQHTGKSFTIKSK
jgi:hypothetical protein